MAKGYAQRYGVDTMKHSLQLFDSPLCGIVTLLKSGFLPYHRSYGVISTAVLTVQYFCVGSRRDSLSPVTFRNSSVNNHRSCIAIPSGYGSYIPPHHSAVVCEEQSARDESPNSFQILSTAIALSEQSIPIMPPASLVTSIFVLLESFNFCLMK